MTFRILIGILAVLADSLMMFKKYRNDDLVGVIFWGILLTCVIISFN